jgi:hypothetical protein
VIDGVDLPVIDAAQESRINEKRKKIVGEILSTEESYVQSLMILIEVCRPLHGIVRCVAIS